MHILISKQCADPAEFQPDNVWNGGKFFVCLFLLQYKLASVMLP